MRTPLQGIAAALLISALAGCASESMADCCSAPAKSVVRHVVLLKFKDGTTPDQIKTVEAAFVALKGKIPTIQDLEWGTDLSPEKLAQGFTHCFFLTFKDAAGRDAYLSHPAHKEFGGVLRPVLDKVLVIDYQSRN